MTEEAEISTPLLECIRQLQSILAQHIRLIDNVIAVAVNHESAQAVRQNGTAIPPITAQVISIMLQAVGSTSHTIVLLSNKSGLQTRDCYSLARSVVETSVNVCFILAEGDAMADRALRHARQKAYQDLDRVSHIGKNVIRVKFSARPDAASIPGLNAELKEFTSRTGREH